MIDNTNYVIYHRNNNMLGLRNHIDNDGELDDNYALLRNTALRGKFVGGRFVSYNPKRFNWLIECAKKGCPICNGIFKDAKNNDYNIKKFYVDRVVRIVDKDGKEIKKEFMMKSAYDDFDEFVEDVKRKFNGRSIK